MPVHWRHHCMLVNGVMASNIVARRTEVAALHEQRQWGDRWMMF